MSPPQRICDMGVRVSKSGNIAIWQVTRWRGSDWAYHPVCRQKVRLVSQVKEMKER